MNIFKFIIQRGCTIGTSFLMSKYDKNGKITLAIFAFRREKVLCDGKYGIFKMD